MDIMKGRAGMQRARRRGGFRSLWRVSIVLLALAGLPAAGTNAALAQSPDNAPVETEFEKQQRIYQSTGAEVPAGYSIDRSLADYARGLPAGFQDAVAAMRPTDRWLDIGAGQGRAILDYYTADYDASNPAGRNARDGKAKAVAISIEDRRTPAWYHTSSSLPANQIQYLFGRRFGEYAPDALGKFRVITDLLGGFSYTDGLSEFLQKALGLLEVEGSFFTLLQDVHSESGGNKPFYADSRYLTELENADGSELKVCDWLKRIGCVEVACQYRQDWRPRVEGYQIKKVCENVTVPALDRTHFAAGTPPERRFKLRSPPSASGGATPAQTDKPR